jgi:hypothetical protein
MADRASAALAIGTASLVVGVYGASLPTLADARGQADDRGHLAAGERYAALVAVAVVLGVAGATRSAEAALVGLVAVVGMAAAYHGAVSATP